LQETTDGRRSALHLKIHQHSTKHGERTKAAIAQQRKFSALLKMLRAGLT
jgi:hypothetical protein